MVYMFAPLVVIGAGGGSLYAINFVFHSTASATAKSWHRLPASCEPYPSQWSDKPQPTASTSLGTVVALATACVSMRVGHGLIWHRIFSHQLAGGAAASSGKIETFQQFAKSFAPPFFATYCNAVSSAVPAGIVKALVDGPGLHPPRPV